MALMKVVNDEADQVLSKEEASLESYPTFGPHPNTEWLLLIFEKK